MDNEEWKYGDCGKPLEANVAFKLAANQTRVLITCPESEGLAEVWMVESTPDGSFVKISQSSGWMGGSTKWLRIEDIRLIHVFPKPPEPKKAPISKAYLEAPFGEIDYDGGSGGT